MKQQVSNLRETTPMRKIVRGRMTPWIVTLFLFFLSAAAAFGAGNGLKGEYFNDTGLLGQPTLTRTDSTIDFEWNIGGPGGGIDDNYFSARWTGQVEAPVTGAFRFVTFSNNGARLWVNHVEVINHWGSHGTAKDTSALVNLTAGNKYDIKMEFYETSGTAAARLLWIVPGQPEAVIPQAHLYSPAVSAPLLEPVYLSSLNPTFQENGWGPYQRDRSNGEAGANDGHVIGIGGIKFARGLGVHARSELRYALAGKFLQFLAQIGIDDEVGNRGSVAFEVWLDGKRVFNSPVLRGSDTAKPVSVDVTGKNELKLIVLNGGDGIGYDHADWADAHVTAIPGTVPIPPVPTGVTAVPGERHITISWSPAAGADSYNVYRATVADGESTTPFVGGLTETNFRDTDLTDGKKYFYRIVALNDAGQSTRSSEVSATPGTSGGTPPPAPTGLTGMAGDKQITLLWTASAGATSYSLFRGSSANGEASAPMKTDITGTTYTNTGLTDGTTYFYKIAAVNGGGMSAMSNEASATPSSAPPPPAPPAPTGLAATAGDKQVALTWTASAGASSYALFLGTSANGEGVAPVKTGITGTSYTSPGLTDGTTYFFKLAAVNAGGMSTMSNEASATPAGAPLPPAPTGLTSTAGDAKVTLTWNAVATAGATYSVFRGTTTNGEASAAVMTGLTSATFTNTGLTNGTTYFFKVTAVVGGVSSAMSTETSATPAAVPPPPAPTGLAAAPGDRQAVLTWTAIATPGATYNVFRGTATNAESNAAVGSGLTSPTFTNTGLTNGTAYFFKVTAVVGGVSSAMSNEATATPAPLPAPTGLTATPGDKTVLLTWTAVPGAATYNVYRGTAANGEATTPVASSLAAPTFTNTGLTNGTAYFFKVAAVSAAASVGNKSNEVSVTPTAPGLLLSAAQMDAFKFLRQATFGPTMTMVDHVVAVGKSAFIDEQMALPPTPYPDTLITMPNMELVSEQFFQNSVSGADQLRQRVGWALSQIFVVSATKVDNTHAMVPYIRMLETRAFDNVKTIMHDVSLSPAMGEFLDMVNNKKFDPANGPNGPLPNENYAREWLQLFSIGLVQLQNSGAPMPGNPPTYDQAVVADLARALTGWTYGDNKTTNPTNLNPPFYDGPMKPVDKFHDTLGKTVLGVPFPAGQNAQADFDMALNTVFTHPNVGPFLVRELIQRLVTSNPSPTYVADIVAVFNNNGGGVRGDLKAVVKAILLHAEAATTGGAPTFGKFAEPALFLTSVCRVICTNITDHPFMSDFSENMAQKIWFAPSVFNYFSPNYRSGSLFAPELQIWSTANAMTRTNWVATLLSGGFGGGVTLNLAPFTAVANDANALTDTVNALLMGGTMSAPMRGAMITAIQASTNVQERVDSALYVAASSMQYQVEH